MTNLNQRLWWWDFFGSNFGTLGFSKASFTASFPFLATTGEQRLWAQRRSGERERKQHTSTPQVSIDDLGLRSSASSKHLTTMNGVRKLPGGVTSLRQWHQPNASMLLCRFWECQPKNLHVRVASRRIHDRAEMHSNLHSPFSRSLLQNSDSKRLKSQTILCSWLLAPVSSSHATRLFLTISTWSWRGIHGKAAKSQHVQHVMFLGQMSISCKTLKLSSAIVPTFLAFIDWWLIGVQNFPSTSIFDIYACFVCVTSKETTCKALIHIINCVYIFVYMWNRMNIYEKNNKMFKYIHINIIIIINHIL